MCKFKLDDLIWIFSLHLLLLFPAEGNNRGKNLDVFLAGLKEAENGTEDSNNDSDWRAGLNVIDKNEFMLSNDLLTDCTILVGPHKEPIKAHRLFLSRASPILAAYLSNNTQTIHLDDVTVQNFRALLRYMYRGSFCAASAEEACGLLRHAKRYQMHALEEKIRTYLWINMYPDKVWSTFRCAADNNDQFLTQAALYVISWRTEELIADPAFLELPHSALLQLLQLRTLNLTTQYSAPVPPSGPLPPVEVSAEMKLFDALLHWAVAEAERKGLDPSNPESIRGVLGTVFKNLHAIMLNFDDFSAGSSTGDPSYNEALDVLYNTNSIYQPSVLHSPSLKSRKPESLEVHGSLDYLSCNRSSGRHIFDILTSSEVSRSFGSRRLMGVQLPARQMNIGDQCIVTEDFTVEVLDVKGVLLQEQRVTLAHTNVCAKAGSKHVDVHFASGVPVPSRGGRVRVVYHSTPGKYPSTCAGFTLNAPSFYDESSHELVKQPDSFVCSYVFEKK